MKIHPRYPPYKEANIKLLKMLLKSRWLPMMSDFKTVVSFLIGMAFTGALYNIFQ